MSDVQTEAFLSGLGIEVDPVAIEQTLNDLWGPAAERVGGPEVENPPVTRVVLANLIVETTLANCQRVAEALDTIAARYPCRAIVAIRNVAPGRKITAEVAAVCHLPAPGLPQVCSERILLSAGPEALDLLPGAIRPLLEPDLPVVLWWTSNPHSAEALFVDLANEATRVILDLREADNSALGFGLNPKLNPYARDVAWFGLTFWRDLIAQCFDCADRWTMVAQVRSVEIVAAAREQGPTIPRPSAWLAAWLAGQLGWKLEGSEVTPDGLEARFASDSGPVVVRFRVEVRQEDEDARVVEVNLSGNGEPQVSRFSIKRSPREGTCVLVEASSPHACELPRFVEAPITNIARKVSAGMESARHDIPFQRALPIALALLEIKR